RAVPALGGQRKDAGRRLRRPRARGPGPEEGERARRPPDRAAAPPDQLRPPLHRRRQREPARPPPSPGRDPRRHPRPPARRGAPVGLGPGVSPRYLALAADYDGTLAYRGRVEEATLAALRRVRASGRRLLLVTGRELPSLFATFDRPELFDLVVAENGGLLYE